MEPGRIAAGEGIPLWLWAIPAAYTAVPIGIGTLAGIGVLRGWRWTKILTGLDPAPRAWDYLFGGRPDGWVRFRLKSGIWLGGAFAPRGEQRSYASGYPESGDLYLAQAASLDPDTGEFQFDDDGEVVLLEQGILVRWEEIEYLEFIDA